MAEQRLMDQSISSSRPVATSSPSSVRDIDLSTKVASAKDLQSKKPSPATTPLLSVEKPVLVFDHAKALARSTTQRKKRVELAQQQGSQENTKSALASESSAGKAVLVNSATLIVRELEKFDPTVPDEELPPSQKQQEQSSDKSIEENSSAISQLAQYMELHTVHPVIKSFLVGSISGTCSTVLFQPLDLLKTRLQTPPIRHGGPATAAALRASSVAAAAAAVGPNGVFTLLGHIIRNERLFGLWKGMTPSLTRCVPGVGLYFASIHGLKIAFDIHGEPTPVQSVLLGVTGRSISGVLMIPFTVIKTRYESTVYNYGSIREALQSIYRQEGYRGLTCGLLPTLLRDAPFSGLYLLMYTSTKKAVPQEYIESTTFGPYVRFSCGVVAGIGASLITQPADVLKTKMQLYPDKFHSIPEVVSYVYKKYGAQGYFKGLMPRMIRRTLIAAMSWTVYEQVMKSIGLK